MNNKKDNLTKNGTIVFILTTLSSAINYLCQILMGKFFSIETYGTINTIFSLTLIITVVGNTAFMLLSKSISGKRKNKFEIYQQIIRLVNKCCLLIIGISILAFPILKKMLDTDITAVIFTVICLITSIYPILYQGVFGGLNKFISLGLYTLIIPFFKLFGVIIINICNLNGTLELYSIIIFIIIGNIISIMVGRSAAKKHLKESKFLTDNNSIFKEYVNIFLVNSLIMLLMNIDILYLSYYYDSKTIGLYSSVLIFGKMVYYFVTALVTVMLPIISKDGTDNKYAKKILYQTLFYTFMLTVIFLIPVNLFSKNILNIIFGTKYLDAFHYMRYASFISLSYSLNVIIFNYLVGINKIDFIKKTLIVGSFLCVILLIGLNDHQYISLLFIGIVNTIIFIINLIKVQGENLVGGSK